MPNNLEELIENAYDAFIPVPSDLDDYEVFDFPHWWLYFMLNYGTGATPDQLNHNAHVISRVSDEKIMKVGPSDVAGVI